MVTPPVTTPTLIAGDIVDTSGAVVASAYKAMALNMGTDAGIVYRYGAPSTASKTSTTYLGPRANKSYQTLSVQRKEVQSDGVVGERSCGATGWCGEYQIGDRLTGNPLDYSSSILNVGYLPDATPPAGFIEKKYYGVASLQQISVAHNTIAWKPEPSWTTYDGAAFDGGSNDENTVRIFGGKPGSTVGTATPDQKPVASARGYGRGGWVNNTLAVFANGWITSSGSNTSHNMLKMKLPDGKTPTAIAISNSGEFALVTVWDTAAVKGQIAVIALADGCAWCETQPEAQWDSNWGSSRQAYAGFPGLGNYVSAKLVGFVDLPDTVKAPTEITVSTGVGDREYQKVQRYFDDHIQTEAARARYWSGDLVDAIAKTGMAVVISKSEKRAVFVDLKPLFQYYRSQYTNQNQTAWNAMIANRGTADTQWPYSFSVAPTQKPTIIKVVDLPAKPTAVRMALEGPSRVMIATEEGKMRVFDLGSSYLNKSGTAVGSPSDIVEKFSIDVGKNPTSIKHVKEHGWAGSTKLFGTANVIQRHYWVLSREERKASIVQFDAALNSASIFKTLQDSRMDDPISVEDTDNHGTESYVLSVADYSGKKVHNYAYGPIVMWTHNAGTAPCPQPNGCQLQGGQAFEYAGSFSLPGKPFHLSGSNIN